MRLLLRLTFRSWATIRLVLISMIFLCSLTIAEKLEVFSFGVLVNRGADFFVLFAPEKKNGELSPQHEVSREVVEKRWNEIAKKDSGVITKQEASKYLSRKSGGGLLDMIQAYLDAHFQISENIFRLIYLFALVAVFKAVSFFGSKYTTTLIAARVSKNLRRDYFKHIQKLSIRFYQERNVGMIATRVIGDAGNVAQAISSSLFNYFQTPFLVLTSLVFCIKLSWQLSLVVFVLCPILLFPIIFFSRKVRRISGDMLKNQEDFMGFILEFLGGIYTIKLFSNEEYSLNRFNKENERIAYLEKKNARYSFSSRPVLHAISTMTFISVLLYGLYVLAIPLAEILVFALLVHQFYEPIKKFNDENLQIQRGIVAAERMNEVFSLIPEIKDKPDAKDFKGLEKEINFHNVWFKYRDHEIDEEESWVLKGINLSIKKGQTVALVGPTGSGKSSLVNLIPRLYDPAEGQITFDGVPLDALKQASLRQGIAFVPQRAFIVDGTVAENIAFGMECSIEEIKEAAIKAHADEFIQRFPNAYNERLTESGKNLSGGQQQRIAIARALLRKTDILVLDEATSSLDTVSERNIKLALDEMQGMTKVIIAHRLSTIANADCIYYLNRGEILAHGKKDELLQSCPEFKHMWEAMFLEEQQGR